MLAAALLSLGVVFLAEFGDRSQLITMTYALRYGWWVVLPVASALAFLIFAVWTWREGAATGESVPAAP
jgi:putative Ca2+/H+ antiporter (TMEM165/GDT1 family)